MEKQNEKLAREIESYLKDVFHHLHKNPELGTQEHQTQKFILNELEKMGIEGDYQKIVPFWRLKMNFILKRQFL